MIIKSLSRKGGAGGFTQLYDYMTKKAEKDRIWHNLYCNVQDRNAVIREFVDNSKHLKISPRHNILYHEVISLKRNERVNEKDQIAALKRIAHSYLQKRASNQLAYCTIHLDQKETVHLHMMISANQIHCKRRVRIPKHEFLSIQKEVELELQRNFPELAERTVYNKPWERDKEPTQNPPEKEKSQTRNEPQPEKQRTPQKGQKEQLREILEQVFTHASSREEVNIALKVYEIDLTQRGKNITASWNGLKCRLSTLGLDEAYQSIGKENTPNPSQKKERKSTPEKEIAPEEQISEKEKRRRERKAELDEIYRRKRERGYEGYERTRER